MCLKKVLKCRISKALQTLSSLFLDSNVVSGARACVRCLVYVKCGSRRELGEGQRRADTVCIVKRQRKPSDSEENTNQAGEGLKAEGAGVAATLQTPFSRWSWGAGLIGMTTQPRLPVQGRL